MNFETNSFNIAAIENQIVPVKPGGKILFANVPADGHFNPLSGLAKYLQDIGYDVRWYTSTKYDEKIRKMGIPRYHFKRALDISASDIEEIFPDREQHKSQVAKLRYDLINVFLLRAPEYFADIKEIYQEFPFELMIADVSFTALPIVKEKLDVPVIAVGVVPLMESSKDLPPYGLGLTPSFSLLGKIRNSILRYVTDKFIFNKPNEVMKDILRKYGIEPLPVNLFDQQMRKSNLVIQSGTPGFEYPRTDIGENVRFVGPLLPFDKQKERPKWTSPKLKQYSKIVLVTQGTVEKDVEKIIVPTLEAFKGTDTLVVVTTGGSSTQELRVRYPQTNFIIEDFIPFNDIMPLADIYISNGGYGGVLLGIQHGLPMVVGGIHEGKNEINARVGYFKLGINLKTESPRPSEVRKAVEKILADTAYRTNVEKLKKEFKEYNPQQLTARYVAELLMEKDKGQVGTFGPKARETNEKIY